MKSVRFRTLGCYPLTGAIESNASNLLDIIEEYYPRTNRRDRDEPLIMIEALQWRQKNVKAISDEWQRRKRTQLIIEKH